MDRILVVDFGGQYAHLIANRLRRLGYLADISLPEDVLHEEGAKKGKTAGIILSGGPASVYEAGAPVAPMEIFDWGIPVLGICYGHQWIAHALKGSVEPGTVKEYGLARVAVKRSRLFAGLAGEERAWMSHGDTVKRLPEGFHGIASTPDCPVAAMESADGRIFGLQFHPEVTHTDHGLGILENFALICGMKKEWDVETYVRSIADSVTKDAEGKKVFLLVSGGVDSVVLFTLLNATLGKGRVQGLLVDTGLMRRGETREVASSLRTLGLDNLDIVDASEAFLSRLAGIADPEAKRKAIGDLFIEIVDGRVDFLKSRGWIVAQGTIYPDTIESRGTKNAALIKTHHNRVDRMRELIAEGRVIEPLSCLYKDEVRLLGRKLGLPDRIIGRHPFPGPGLAVRILCNREEEEDLVPLGKEVKALVHEACVLPIRSVGVQGDGRTYRHPAAVPFVNDWDALEQASTRLTNSIPGINRVVAVVGGSGTPTLAKRTITRERVILLQQADAEVMRIVRDAGWYERVWQMPVILAPLSFQGGEAVILRPVESEEAMTARFSRLPFRLVEKIAKSILGMDGVNYVYYDITNKPPGTIEWE